MGISYKKLGEGQSNTLLHHIILTLSGTLLELIVLTVTINLGKWLNDTSESASEIK